MFIVGKYFNSKNPINNGRPTNILVNLYKKRYENYYGCKLSEREESKLHLAIVEFFKNHALDFKNEGDKDWFIENVLDELFEKYDKLGYASKEFPRFCANSLKTFLIDNLIDNVPNRQKDIELYYKHFEEMYGVPPLISNEEFNTLKEYCNKIFKEDSIEFILELMNYYEKLKQVGDITDSNNFGLSLLRNPKRRSSLHLLVSDFYEYKNQKEKEKRN